MADPMRSPWYRQILREGEKRAGLETRRKHVLVGLDIRFGPVPPALAERVRTITDPEVRLTLLKLTYTAASLEEFERAIP